jgi:hypothetical protein
VTCCAWSHVRAPVAPAAAAIAHAAHMAHYSTRRTGRHGRLAGVGARTKTSGAACQQRRLRGPRAVTDRRRHATADRGSDRPSRPRSRRDLDAKWAHLRADRAGRFERTTSGSRGERSIHRLEALAAARPPASSNGQRGRRSECGVSFASGCDRARPDVSPPSCGQPGGRTEPSPSF